MAKGTFILILILSACFPVNALSIDEQSEQIEDLFETMSEEFNELPDLDLIEFLSENPIFLPDAQIRDIIQLPGFTNKLAEKIIYYSKKNDLISIEDIADFLNLTYTQKLLLEICTTLDMPESKQSNKELGVSIRIRSQHLLSKIKGYENGKYPGKPVDILQRYYFKKSNVAAGFLTSKDPGETSLVDYYSGFVSYQKGNTKIIAGDYYLKAGLGTILWNNFGNRKGIDVTPDINQTQLGIFPYRSSMDINFFRGICLNQHFILSENAALQITGFTSSINRSASINKESNTVSSIYLTGLYRTESEISKKDAVNETTFGGNLELEFYNVTLGYTGLNLNYSKPIYSKSASAFYGKNGMLNSVYSSINLDGINVGAEVGIDANNNYAFKGGLDHKTKQFNITLHYRNFAQSFRSPYGYMFGEISSPANESGFYFGIQWKGLNQLKLFGYADIYRTISKASSENVPVRGLDLFSEARWKVNPVNELILRLRYEDKTDSYSGTNTLTQEIYIKNRSSIRIEWKRKYKNKSKLRLRIESSLVDFEGYLPVENGIMSSIEYQSPIGDFLILGARITYFNTDSYTSALWQFEYALPGYMTTALLNGKGYRLICFLRFNIAKSIDLWFRYAQTTKEGETRLGSGNDQIIGNSDKKLFIQIDARF